MKHRRVCLRAAALTPGQTKLGEEILLRQRDFDELYFNAIVHANLPLSIGENEHFAKLLLAGKGRSTLNIPSARQLGRRLDKVRVNRSTVIRVSLKYL